jgi:TPR repeat protein
MKRIAIAAAASLLTLLALPGLAAGTVAAAAQASTAAEVPAAIAALHRQAVDGDMQAQYDLAIVLLCGRRVPRDPAQAALWLALASARGHLGAQSVLGWLLMSAPRAGPSRPPHGGSSKVAQPPLLETGTGVKRDDMHAAHWLERAAAGADTAAMNNLGVLYATGRGVDADAARAERWFRAAAAQGASDAARNLEVLLGGAAPAPAARRDVAASVHPALAGACGPRPPALKKTR